MKQTDDIPGMVKGFENRILCSDGSCVGVIGEDGSCCVCRKVGSKPPTAGDSTGFHSSADEEEKPLQADASGFKDLVDEGLKDEFDPGRKICSDGSCIGVIGADGVCKECGKSFRDTNA